MIKNKYKDVDLTFSFPETYIKWKQRNIKQAQILFFENIYIKNPMKFAIYKIYMIYEFWTKNINIRLYKN